MRPTTVLDLFRFIYDSHRKGRDILDIQGIIDPLMDPKDVEELSESMTSDGNPEIEDPEYQRTLMKVWDEDHYNYDLTFKGLKFLFWRSPDLMHSTYEAFQKNPNEPSRQPDYLAMRTVFEEIRDTRS